MGRWLAAIVMLVCGLAAALVVFLNGGEAVAIRLTPSRTITAPLGGALAVAFAGGVTVVALLAIAGGLVRRVRRWSRRRRDARTTERRVRARVRAERLLVEGDSEGARARLTDAVARHGADERLLELLAGASEQHGDLPAAIAALEEARRTTPTSPMLARRLATLYAAAGRWEDALAVEPSVREPDGDRTCGFRYEAACADTDPARGLRRLLLLAHEHPGFVPAWVAAGDRLRDAGRAWRARVVYERGARACPAPVLLERLAATADHGRAALRRIARRHPTDVAVVAQLARKALADGSLDEAEDVLRRWEGAEGTSALIDALHAEVARRRGRADAAITHFRRATSALLTAGSPYRCRACGTGAPDWTARCAACGRWNILAADHCVANSGG